MSLVKCPECGNLVSEHALECPKCGFPISQKINSVEKNDLIESKNGVNEAELICTDKSLNSEPKKTETSLTNKTKSSKIIIIIGAIVVAFLIFLIFNPFGNIPNGDYEYVSDRFTANADTLNGDTMVSSKVSMQIDGKTIHFNYYGKTYDGVLTKKSESQMFDYSYAVEWDEVPTMIDVIGAEYCGTSLFKGTDYPQLQFTYTWYDIETELTTGEDTFTSLLQTIFFEKK